jgi:hypothetical protein
MYILTTDILLLTAAPDDRPVLGSERAPHMTKTVSTGLQKAAHCRSPTGQTLNWLRGSVYNFHEKLCSTAFTNSCYPRVLVEVTSGESLSASTGYPLCASFYKTFNGKLYLLRKNALWLGECQSQLRKNLCPAFWWLKRRQRSNEHESSVTSFWVLSIQIFRRAQGVFPLSTSVVITCSHSSTRFFIYYSSYCQPIYGTTETASFKQSA